MAQGEEEDGYVLLHRRLFRADGPFAGDEFSRRDAWMWLICRAAFFAHTVTHGPFEIPIDRGQVCITVRQMAEQFGWSRMKVQRFVEQLVAEGMVSLHQPPRRRGLYPPMVITITRYDHYNDPAATKQRPPAEPRHQRDPDLLTAVNESLFDDEFWPAYHPERRVGKKNAREQWHAAIRRGADPAMLVERAKAYTRAWMAAGTNPKHVPYPERWLKHERYKDDPEHAVGGPAGNGRGGAFGSFMAGALDSVVGGEDADPRRPVSRPAAIEDRRGDAALYD